MSNKVNKYLIYAIGEIFLVVVGILIALQINNWNEKIKERKQFEFGLKEVNLQLLSEKFSLLALPDIIGLQLKYADTILNHSDKISPDRIPGMIQLLDYSGFSGNKNIERLISPFLQLNENDEVQNELSKSLQKFTQNNTYDFSDLFLNFEPLNIDIKLFDHLRTYNIPTRYLSYAASYPDFVKPPIDFYTEEHLSYVIKLLDDPGFQADLITIAQIKKDYLNDLIDLIRIGESVLDFLKEHFPSSTYEINYIEIIGSGSSENNWAIGVPMKKIKPGIFELESELNNGEIKFRTDKNYSMDWGGAQLDKKKLAYKGTNIKVNKGYFNIKIDINKNFYSILPVEK